MMAKASDDAGSAMTDVAGEHKSCIVSDVVKTDTTAAAAVAEGKKEAATKSIATGAAAAAAVASTGTSSVSSQILAKQMDQSITTIQQNLSSTSTKVHRFGTVRSSLNSKGEVIKLSDAAWLQENVSDVLMRALIKVTQQRPSNPIQEIAKKLKCEQLRQVAKMEAVQHAEKDEDEYERYMADAKAKDASK